MNSESGQKLSLDELKQRNTQQDTQPTPQVVPQPIVIQCAMPEVLEYVKKSMEDILQYDMIQAELLREIYKGHQSPVYYGQVEDLQKKMNKLLDQIESLKTLVEQNAQAGNENAGYVSGRIRWNTILTPVILVGLLVLLHSLGVL